MDISDTIVPRSDQLNAEDLLSGPRTVTVEKVTKGSAEQPVDIHLVEFPRRPFRPSKTVRRLLVAAWGPDASTYTGRRMTLYRDPDVKFGGMDVGGIRVSHLSHIDKPLKVALTVTRGRRQFYTVQPLKNTDAPGHPAADDGSTGRPDADHPGASVTREQLAEIAARMGALGIGRGDALAYVVDVIGRDVKSSNDLTAGEASRLIEHMALALGEVPPTVEEA